jgi:hypothetical protein
MEPVGLILLCWVVLLIIVIINRRDIHKLRKELKDWQDGLFVPHAKKEDDERFK